MKKQIIIGVVILIVLILMPFVINLLIQIPAQFDVVGEPVNWLMFWPTYISAAASFIMIYVTYLSLKQNREQLDEMKRQWDEEHKPEIIAYMTIHENYFYVCIKNTSRVPIHNIKVSITHVPTKGILPSKEYFLNKIDNASFAIEAGGSRYINTYALETCTPVQEDFLGLQFSYANNIIYKVDLPFKEGSIIKDSPTNKKVLTDIHNISTTLQQIERKRN